MVEAAEVGNDGDSRDVTRLFDLALCPFCGSSAKLMDTGAEYTQCVECSNDACGAEGPCRHVLSDAAFAWNMRAPR